MPPDRARDAAPTPEDLQDAAATFGLLATPVRLHILWLLARGELDVGSLAEQTGQSMATVSHHLGKLKLAGLVRSRRAGKHQIYLAEARHITDVVTAIVDRPGRLRDGRARGA